MPRILVTNDDGIRSDGLESLVVALGELGDVVAVAPLLESLLNPAAAVAIGSNRTRKVQRGRHAG